MLGRNFCKSHIDFSEAAPVRNNLGFEVANNLHLPRTVHVDRVDYPKHQADRLFDLLHPLAFGRCNADREVAYAFRQLILDDP